RQPLFISLDGLIVRLHLGVAGLSLRQPRVRLAQAIPDRHLISIHFGGFVQVVDGGLIVRHFLCRIGIGLRGLHRILRGVVGIVQSLILLDRLGIFLQLGFILLALLLAHSASLVLRQ